MEITQSWAEKYVFLMMFWPDLSTNLSKSKYSFPSPKPSWAISRFWFSVLIFRISTISFWNVLNITIWLPKLEVNLSSSVSFLFFPSWAWTIFYLGILQLWISQVALVVKNPPANAGDRRDAGSISELGRSSGERHGNPLQYSCWGIPWTEEPGGLQSMGPQRIGHAWATEHACMQCKYFSLKQTNFCKDCICNSEWES